MGSWKEYIESGQLELYTMGSLQDGERQEAEEMIAKHAEVKTEFDQIEESLERYAQAHAIEPPIDARALLMATIDFTKRMMEGEQVSSPPEMSPKTTVADYGEWLDRPDMLASEEYDDMFVKLVEANESKLSAIVWLKTGAPPEVHSDVFERFLVVEGTCDIHIIENEETTVHSLEKGDFLEIPLFATHKVVVTSLKPCKVFLQRVAA